MFTGLVEDLGEVLDLTPDGDGQRLRVRSTLVAADASHGDSIAVNGVCLTIVDHTDTEISLDVMAQTLAVTGLGNLGAGAPVNLERALRADARLGGHVVQGHCDARAVVAEIHPGQQWRKIRFALLGDAATTTVAPLIVDRGSITVDGVSLTVSAVSAPAETTPWFEVSLIPETLRATTLGQLGPGDAVNLETDVLARHLARLAQFDRSLNVPFDRTSAN
ncbi:riboflavin synthase [Auritidibacter ignavus]|uniref:riboflavin synthase n=1 Tax=Auritidibacter ignavus TaxID=678932 RepID=UPI00109CE509|nr:riboflavin synthase [Auritidibacter ignavus]